jgi:hypothetical protein
MTNVDVFFEALTEMLSKTAAPDTGRAYRDEIEREETSKDKKVQRAFKGVGAAIGAGAGLYSAKVGRHVAAVPQTVINRGHNMFGKWKGQKVIPGTPAHYVKSGRGAWTSSLGGAAAGGLIGHVAGKLYRHANTAKRNIERRPSYAPKG